MFTFNPTGNPNSNGRGNAIRIGHTESDAVSILLDEYQYIGPGVTLSLHRDTGRCDIIDTDDGCALRFVATDYDVTIVLPISMMSLRTELDMATDDRTKIVDPEPDDKQSLAEMLLGSDIDAPFREDYEPSPYNGDYSED